jgi:hypothetical protein
VTFCDFKIRNLGDNIHQHSVQCALPINLFNEKFFIMFWFWLIILTIFTISSFLNWFKIVVPSYRKNTIAKYLRSHSKLGDNEKDKEMLNTFVNEYCHLDGAFIFQIIRNNSNFITTSEIICTLWSKYCREYFRHHQKINILNSQKTSQNEKNESVEIGIIDYDEEQEKLPFHP